MLAFDFNKMHIVNLIELINNDNIIFIVIHAVYVKVTDPSHV